MSSSTQQSEKSPPTWMRLPNKFLHFFGFQKWYNLIFFTIVGGALVGFTLARLSYLNISGSAPSSFASVANPGEWYWYHSGVERIGITLHLSCVLPAGLLIIWQFIPAIRHRFLLFHRINGYIVILLILLSNAGALMICRLAFGGTLETQVGTITLAALTTSSIGMAYYNIKRLQIDQHRAWMLRAMIYMGTIITLRIIMNIANAIISRVNSYYGTMSCDEIAFIYATYGAPVQAVYQYYPQCAPPAPSSTIVAVHANSDMKRPEQIGARGATTFGMAFWFALILHVVGVEIYLHLTPREAGRLRLVSWERQAERGFRYPGSAGLTSDRWGDAEEWKPRGEGERKGGVEGGSGSG